MFEKWKNEERRSKSSYVQHSASHMQGVNRKSYLYCHRSGIVRSEGKGLRALKTQGSCKMNEFCTAHMTVTEDTITKKVKVSYCSHHKNHEPEICHMKVPEDVKNIVAAKLAEGVSIDRILDDIRDNVTGSLEREHIMNPQDIHNIQYQLNLESVEKHQNDHTSVSAWVTEMKEMEYNRILIFKNQGEEQGDDCDDLAKNDFVLAIQMKYQCDMIIKYGEKVICMDDTHGTNMYDFTLITVLVNNEHGEGIPVAWALSNRVDTALLTQFSKPLKANVGDLRTSVFMSDMADQFFISWVGVFGKCNTK